MNDPHEERIGTMLAGLGKAEPVGGMEARLLATLQRAEVLQARAQAARQLPTWGPLWTSGCVAAAFLVVASVLLNPLDRASSRQTIAQRRQAAPMSGATAANVKLNAPGTQPTTRRRPAQSSFAVPRRMRVRAAIDQVSPANDDVSFPAPPLPLTEQEQLLLRLVRHEPPQQLAQLTSRTRKAGFQQEKDAVTEFFVPRAPLPGQQEPLPYLSQAGQP